MKKLLSLAVVIAALVWTPSQRALEAGEFKKAPESCQHAHAVLGWSNFKQGKDESSDDFEARRNMPWSKMGWVVGRMNWGAICGNGEERLKVVGSYEPGVARQASFKQYSVKGHDGALAYVAHCGTGTTCNLLADRLHRLYKGIGKPQVHCGESALPSVLESGSAASLRYPDCETLTETDGDGGGDDFDLGDDDDDDDDEKKKKDKKGDDEPSVDDF